MVFFGFFLGSKMVKLYVQFSKLGPFWRPRVPGIHITTKNDETFNDRFCNNKREISCDGKSCLKVKWSHHCLKNRMNEASLGQTNLFNAMTNLCHQVPQKGLPVNVLVFDS